MEQQLANINQQIDHLLNGLGNEGLLDDQFAQLMQLQVRAAQADTAALSDARADGRPWPCSISGTRTYSTRLRRTRAIQTLWQRSSSSTLRTQQESLIS